MRVANGNIIKRREEKMMSRNVRKEADFQVLHFMYAFLCRYVFYCGL